MVFFFREDVRQNDVHIFAPVTFDLQPLDLKIVLAVTPHVGNLSSNFERCIRCSVFESPLLERDRRTDRRKDAGLQDVTRNAE